MGWKYFLTEVKVAKLKKGEAIAQYSEGVVIRKWRYQREVDLERPKNIFRSTFSYNHFMKGVDRADQIMSYFSCERKTL